jgi:hypothetical protein
VGEPVPEEPELVRDLEVVAGGCLAVSRLDQREEVGAAVTERRPRRGCSGGRVERYDEAGNLRAAARSSSTSGTSPVS